MATDIDKIKDLLEKANKAMYSIPGDPSAKLNKAQRDAYSGVHLLIVHALNAARSAVPASAPEASDAETLVEICAGHEGTIYASSYLPEGTKLYAAQVPSQGELAATGSSPSERKRAWNILCNLMGAVEAAERENYSFQDFLHISKCSRNDYSALRLEHSPQPITQHRRKANELSAEIEQKPIVVLRQWLRRVRHQRIAVRVQPGRVH